MAQWPWEYLFVALNARLGTFYTPFWMVNLALFIMTIVAYAVATRGSRAKGVLGDEWEYLLWIGVTHLRPQPHLRRIPVVRHLPDCHHADRLLSAARHRCESLPATVRW